MPRRATTDSTRAVAPADLLPPGLRDMPAASEDVQAPGQSEKPRAETARDAVDPEVRHRMISEAAYRLYAQRGYVEGFELEDWLRAEAEVTQQLGAHPMPLPENE